MLDVPDKDLGRGFRKISEEYGASPSLRVCPREFDTFSIGDIAYLNVLGQPMIVLGSYDAARAVLEKHSAVTSDRQR